MSRQTINIGTAANDGTGDPLRTAFGKANTNFTELFNVAASKVIHVSKATAATDTRGSNSVYSETVPFATITNAMLAAASGDTVAVGPGTYDEQLQLREGVTPYFMAGAVMDYTGSGSTVLEPVGGAEVSILGHGSFYHTGSEAVQHVFSITEEATNLHVQAEIVECHPEDVNADSENVSTLFIVAANNAGTGGKITLNCHYIEGDGCTAIHHAGGWYYITANEVKSSGAGVSTIRMPGVDGDAISDAFSIGWIIAPKLRSDPTERVLFANGAQAHEGIVYLIVPQISGCIEASPTSGLMECYIDNQLFIPAYESGVISSSGGRALLKLGGSAANVFNLLTKNMTTQGTDPALQINNLLAGSDMHIGSLNTEGGTCVEFNGNAGGAAIYINTMSATTAGTTLIKQTSGSGFLKGDIWTTSTGAAMGVNVVSGTLKISGVRIDGQAAATGNPVLKSGGALVLQNTVLLAATGRAPISAPTAQNVVAMSSYCNTNFTLDADVTLTVSGLTFDADVQ